MTGGGVPITVDGVPVEAPAGGTILDALGGLGLETPTLCHRPGLDPVGSCRACVVELEGSRVLVPSCARRAEPKMVVRTLTERVRRARRMVLELLLADHPAPCAKEQARRGACELEAQARRLGIERSRFARAARERRTVDLSNPAIQVDLEACILCHRCVRACDVVQVNDVIGLRDRGHGTEVIFDYGDPMGRSSCVSCGECVSVCPTGALLERPLVPGAPRPRFGGRARWQEGPPPTAALPVLPRLASDAVVRSVCPYCGVGCNIDYHVKDGHVARVTSRLDYATNRGRLCVKGRFGYDFADHPDRLTAPLLRLEGVPKGPWPPGGSVRDAFREATWDEALDRAARAFRETKERFGGEALAGFGSAKCSNEDNYLFQKLIRRGFGSNHVDFCTRLCHASSVTALIEAVGSGSMSNTIDDIADSDCMLVVGSNTTENHPVIATFMKQNARRRGAALIVLDPREVDLCRHATIHLRQKPGTDVAVLNGLAHVVLREGLEARDFIRDRTEGFEAFSQALEPYAPEFVEHVSGVPAGLIEEAGRAFARARAAAVFWGMGVSQHTTGTDNSFGLINLVLLTGQVGRPGTGLNPLRGQNNVQGVSDVGVLPMYFPGYQPTTDAAVHARFEAAWGGPLPREPGLTVTEILGAALEKRIRAMYIMGENPFLSDPNIEKVKKCLKALDFLLVQDIFLTETAEYADVVLPAAAYNEKTGTFINTDRRVQLARAANKPPGEARGDGDVVCEIARRLGLDGWTADPETVWAECASLAPIFGGITYARIAEAEADGRSVHWPCRSADDPGEPILYSKTFPRPGGKGRFTPIHYERPAKELPDEEYPYVLNTGRVLEHWHTGTMTRRASALDALAPEPYVEVNPKDLHQEALTDGERVRLRSRRGAIELRVMATPRCPPGSVFVPFHFREAAANELTIDALDPRAKIPEFKFCAVRIEKLGARA